MRGWLSAVVLSVAVAGGAVVAGPSFADDHGAKATEGEATKGPMPVAPKDVDWSIIPDSVDGLKGLNTEQLRDLRRFAELCDYDVNMNYDESPCVISDLNDYIWQYRSPQMVAFHFGMLPNMRYDANRTTADLERFVTRRNEMAKKYGSDN